MSAAGASTQDHLPVAGIQDGVVIMNDTSVRAILRVQPINFELKSEAEQNAIIYSYQSFLNSLDFPVEIVINSKKLDLERYLRKLEEQKKNLSSDLLRIQIEDYVNFVRRLITIANIMAKRFYVVVSYAAVTGAKASSGFSLSTVLGIGGGNTQATLYQDQFDRYKAELGNRANIVSAGLTRVGLRVEPLTTQEIIELLYGAYNPDIAQEERLTDVSALSAGIVSSENVAPPLEQAAEVPPVAVPEAAPAQPTANPPQQPPAV